MLKNRLKVPWCEFSMGHQGHKRAFDETVSAAIGDLISSPVEQPGSIRCGVFGADYIKIGLDVLRQQAKE